MRETPALVARARKLGPAFDLLANYRAGGFFFERSGLGIAGTGVAGRIRAKAGPERILRLARMTTEALGAIRRESDGPSPIAVAAIPTAQPATAVLRPPSAPFDSSILRTADLPVK